MLTEDDLEKMKGLRERIFYLAMPRSGLDIKETRSPPANGAWASVSDRAEVASQIIHVEPVRYGGAAIIRLLRVERELDKMEAIEKISSNVGQLPKRSIDMLEKIGKKYQSHENPAVRLNANKFMTIARDCMAAKVQKRH